MLNLLLSVPPWQGCSSSLGGEAGRQPGSRQYNRRQNLKNLYYKWQRILSVLQDPESAWRAKRNTCKLIKVWQSNSKDSCWEHCLCLWQATALSFLTLHKGSIREGGREESRGGLFVLARRHNQSPMNSKRNMLLSVINGLGDIHDRFSRECGLWTICWSVSPRGAHVSISDRRKAGQRAQAAFLDCLARHGDAAHLGCVTFPPTLCKSFFIAISYPLTCLKWQKVLGEEGVSFNPKDENLANVGPEG